MIGNEIFNNYFNHLIKGEKNHCMSIIDELLSDKTPVETIYTDLFQRALYQVGEYWEKNRISVATEHMATAITENMMIRLQPLIFATERTGNKAVITCVANEHHQVGAKMIADIFEMNGWDGFFVGANIPADELVRFIDNHKPELIGISLSIYFNLPELTKTLGLIRGHFPSTPILIGGQAFRWGGVEVADKFSLVEHIQDIETLKKYIKLYNRI